MKLLTSFVIFQQVSLESAGKHENILYWFTHKCLRAFNQPMFTIGMPCHSVAIFRHASFN